MMVRPALLLILCGVSFSLFGNDDAAVDSDIETFFDQPCQFAGTFAQTKTIPELPIPLATTGRFLHDCQVGLIWNTTEPKNETLVFTHREEHFRIGADNVSSKLKGQHQQQFAALLLALIGGNSQALQKKFDAQEYRELPDGSSEIDLHPSDRHLQRALQTITLQKRPAYHDVVISIRANDGTITRVVAKNTQKPEGNQTTFDLCNSVFNAVESQTCKILSGTGS